MSRTQLLEVEAKLKSTLAALQERTLQYEELMNSHECLWYCPRSPPPSVFGKSSFSWGLGNTAPGIAAPAKCGCHGCGEAYQSPS